MNSFYILYTDESGDPGIYQENRNSKHFILSGLIFEVTHWNSYLTNLKDIRKMINKKYGLALREEIHAVELIRPSKIKAYRKINKSKRIKLLKDYIKEVSNRLDEVKIINICLDKRKVNLGKSKNYAQIAWTRLIQRYDRFLSLNGGLGIIISDKSDEKLIRNLLRKMRVYNPVKSHYKEYYNPKINKIIEDPFFRDSKHSYFVQTVDVIAYLLYKKEYPQGSLKKYNFHNFFYLIESHLLKEASSTDELGVVRK